MDGKSAGSSASGWIEITDLAPLPSKHPHASQIAKRSLYVWRPPSDLIPTLDKDHGLALECSTFHDGIRRFSPVSGALMPSGVFQSDTTIFALQASIGGRALMWHRGQENPYPLLTFEEHRLFFQYAQHLSEGLGKTRLLGNALAISRAGRNWGGDRDVLPDDIGLGRNGEANRWSIGELKEEGRREAKMRRVLNPTENDIVRLGLVAAADCNPLEMSDEQANRITRHALYELGPDGEV
jgi:hypothetical protein